MPKRSRHSRKKKSKKVKLWSDNEDPFEGTGVVIVRNEKQFAKEIFEAGEKLLVVVFSAKWGPPSSKVVARFKVLSQMFHKARFIKADPDKCKGVAQILNINVTPTFVLYKDQNVLETIRCPDMKSLELFIAVHYGEPV
ncbi:hypothetical protein R5R35_005408 [Gryllus longicercus]|uniref:Thioredoxin domain-containing protein n=1 Tax=Gryllus longicercus TaxID=2509291 RepID=A0AAN9VUX2_9ORTH